MTSSEQALSVSVGPSTTRVAIRVVAAFVVFSALWFAVGDAAAGFLTQSMGHPMLDPAVRAYLYIGVAALLLTLVIRRYLSVLEAEIRRSQVLMSIANDGIHLVDSNGRIVESNDAFCRLLGYPRSKLIGMHVSQIAGIRAGSASGEGETGVFETSHVRFDGSRVEVEVSASTTVIDGASLVYRVTRDISARKQAERAMRESESWFRQMFDKSIDGILLTTPDGLIHAANPAACGKLGMSEVELRTGGQARVLDPLDPRLAEAVAIRAASGQFRGELSFMRRDGSRFPASVSSVAFAGDNGDVRCITFFRDITERKRAEQAAQAYTNQLNFYLTVIPVIAYSLTFEGRESCTSWVSDNVREMLGYLPAEVREPGWWESRLHPEDREEACAALAQIFSENSVTFEYRFARRDGSYLSICNEARLIRDIARGRTEIVGVWTDITERVYRESEIRKLSLALMQVPESIVIAGIDGSIEYVNETFEQVSGFSRQEAIGRNPRFLSAGTTSPEVYEAMWGALTRGTLWEGELVNRRKDGTLYVEMVKMAPVRQPDGRITNYIAVKRDVTAERQMAAELDRYRLNLEELVDIRTSELAHALQSADSANIAKTAFLANMSHEIRTPLNAITGMTYLLLHSELPAAEKGRLEKIAAASNHLNYLVNDILDLSKIEAGKMQIEKVPFDLRTIIHEAFEIAAGRARSKGLAIECLVDPHLPEWVEGDPLRLRQIFINLANNAVKFTAAGSVSVTASEVVDADGNVGIHCEFRDTGIGMSGEECQRLFQPFQQADSSTTRKYGGSGLGLAISRRLVELMGGTIGVRSERSKGSTFWVTLPLHRVERAALPPHVREVPLPHAPTSKSRGLRILLVEDDPINREVAMALLAAEGHRVRSADNGEDGVREARQGQYDLVLMDMQMPVKDGLTAAREMRGIPGFVATPIIAITGNAFAEDRERCFAAGMNDFIAKPIDPALLYQKIATWSPAGSEPAH